MSLSVVRAFNDAINAGDLDGLARLMTDDHRFVDAAGGTVVGRAACVDAWRGFFAAFPDYRNVFDEVVERAPGVVVALGWSECSDERLAGPARWTATVLDGAVVVWQVDDLDG